MSGSGNEKPPVGQGPQELASNEYYPPPPPGPPPAHQPTNTEQKPALDHFPPPPPGPPPSQQTHHGNDTSLPSHTMPTYNPAHPHLAQTHFAPPPDSEAGLYDEEPIENKPTLPTRPDQTHDTQETAAAKPGWGDRFSGWGAKAAAPLNMLANKIGSEAFLPGTMDKECEKAARILRSFCKDGIYTDTTQPAPPVEGQETAAKPKPKSRTLLTIPSKVISRAVGLAIFTTGRVGFNVSGSTGSGILIARLPDGSWSPPCGIQVHSLGAGFVIGLDIYDCVVVINSKEALDAFTRTRMSLGTDLAVVAGPWGAGGSVDIAAPTSEKGKEKGKEKATKGDSPKIEGQGEKVTEASFTGGPAPSHQPEVTTGLNTTTTDAQSTPADAARPGNERKPSALRAAISKPVYSYVKSRGFYAGVQIDGTVVTQRNDANTKFYGSKVSVEELLGGKVSAGPWQAHTKGLFDIVKGAEGWRGQGSSQNQGSHITANVPTSHLPTSQAPASQSHSTSMPSSHSPTVAPLASHPVDHKIVSPVTPTSHEAPLMSPPGYTENVGNTEQLPAYVDDGQSHAGVGDNKTTH